MDISTSYGKLQLWWQRVGGVKTKADPQCWMVLWKVEEVIEVFQGPFPHQGTVMFLINWNQCTCEKKGRGALKSRNGTYNFQENEWKKEGIKVEKNNKRGSEFPDGPVVKNLPTNAGSTGSLPGWWTKVLPTEWCSQKIKQIKKFEKAH